MPLPLGAPMVAWLARRSLRGGLLGTSRIWFGVFVVTTAVRAVRRFGGSGGAPRVVTEWLSPGETIEVRHLTERVTDTGRRRGSRRSR